jgi:thymidylate synthase (FAD)
VVPDKRFRVEVADLTCSPQVAVWKAMHQDYSENYVADEPTPDEEKAGKIAVKKLLSGERGHYGPLEHAQIIFQVGHFPHSVMQQARTHRIGVSFDVQSMRYTGQRICDLDFNGSNIEDRLEDIFYLRPVGEYMNRQGRKYHYTQAARYRDLEFLEYAASLYAKKVQEGMPEEQARGQLPFDFRQHFVVSFTLRSLMHFLDLRAKKDAQLEIRWLCDLMIPKFKIWVPEIAEWYIQNRLGKARLAP